VTAWLILRRVAYTISSSFYRFFKLSGCCSAVNLISFLSGLLRQLAPLKRIIKPTAKAKIVINQYNVMKNASISLGLGSGNATRSAGSFKIGKRMVKFWSLIDTSPL
jgi:hypothetical protein